MSWKDFCAHVHLKSRHAELWYTVMRRWFIGNALSLNLSNQLCDSFYKMTWDESVETLLQKYCDEAQVREALHRRSYYKYKKLTTCFSLPVICLSALSGSLQFLSKGYKEIEQYIVTGTASVSIFTSILSAVAAYLKLGESKAAHEQAANQWLLFQNEVKHTLSLHRSKRQDAVEFLQNTKTQYDRLFELSPICSNEMIHIIKKKIAAHASDEFQVPTYMNGYSHSTVWREANDDDFESNSA